MTTAKPPHGPPARLHGVTGDDVEIARLLRDASREYAEELDEGAAFRRLSARLERGEARSSGYPSRWTLLVLALGAAGWMLWLEPRGRGPEPPEPLVSAEQQAPAESPRREAPALRADAVLDAGPSQPAAIALSNRATPLAAGHKSTLPDGTVAAVSAGSVVKVANVKSKTRVVLERGRVELDVTPQPPGAGFEVESGAYRFEVLGTVFRVEASSSRVSLEVSEGKVAVWQGQRMVKQVEAGQVWKSELRSESSDVGDRGEQARERDVDCLGLARDGQSREAERCFSQRAAGTGLDAELALYEAARLRVDVLGDSDGALSALSEHAQRFPGGSLRNEVDVFRVELLARLGRAVEALQITELLLASGSGRERAAELYMLRGNVYRQSLADPAAAEREYARAEQLGGAVGAQATYMRGLCFEALDQPAAAMDCYRRYTSVPARPHTKRALARLRQLEQGSRARASELITP